MKKAFILSFIVTVLGWAEYSSAQLYLNNFKNTPEYLNANSNWLLQSDVRLQFTMGNDLPQIVPISLNDTNFFEGCLSFSNPLTGELDFFARNRNTFTGSNKDWLRLINKKSDPSNFMLNGDSIHSGFSVRQAYAIVPVPKAKEQYYLFTHSTINTTSNTLLSYSIVDMTLDNGNGGIVPNKKNISIRDFKTLDSIANLSEVLVAIPGNNCNTWLIAKSGINNPSTNTNVKYFIFEINEQGIQDPSVFYSNAIYGSTFTAVSFPILKVSSDRKKLVSANIPKNNNFFSNMLELELLEFDPETGKLSNSITINDTLLNDGFIFNNLANVEFSPNSQTVYVSRKNKIFKLDVSEMEQNKIQTSLKEALTLNDNEEIGSLNTYGKYIYYKTKNHINIITNSDEFSNNIKTKDSVLLLPQTAKDISHHFLNAVVFPFSINLSPSSIPIGICLEETGKVTIEAKTPETSTSIDEYEFLWSNGATSSSIEVPVIDTIKYWLQTTRFADGCRKVYIDTFKLSKEGIEAPFIQVNANSLSVEDVYAGYQWYKDNQILAGENKHILNVAANGEYKVTVTNKVGCEATTDPYVVNNHTSTNDLDNYGLTIYPNPTQDFLYIQSNISVNYKLADVSGRILKSGEQATMISLKELANGIYKLLIYQEGKLITTQKVIKQN